MLRGVSDTIKDFLFPIFCVGCGKEGFWFCEQCKRRTKVRPFVFYPDNLFFKNGVFAFFPYGKNLILDKLISSWKYDFAQEIIKEWQEICVENIFFLKKYLSGFDSPVSFLPVPLHIRRKHERGFNQSEVLVDIFKNVLSLGGVESKVFNPLSRVRYTRQQAKLNSVDRQKNLSFAFKWKENKKIPRQVILVDDIFTTGSTLKECAQVLQAQGAKEIGAIVLAHG